MHPDELHLPDEAPGVGEPVVEPRGAHHGQPVTSRLVMAIAAVAAVAGALADTRPTGLASVDLLLRVGFATAVTLAATRARRWSWLLVAVLAAAPARDAVAVAPAWAAVGVAFACVVLDVRRRWLGACVGALAATALLRLGDVGPAGLTAVVTLVATIPVLLSAYRHGHRRERRTARRAGFAAGGFVVVAGGGLALAGLLGAREVDVGMDAARAGLAAAKAGNQDQSDVHLRQAAESFAAARAIFGAWYTRPARLVPLLGYQAAALTGMAEVGHDLAATAADVATKADYRSIPMEDGRIGTARIAALAGPLETVDAALGRAATVTAGLDADWLAPPVRRRYDDLRSQVVEARGETATARHAVRVAPDMLGAAGVRRYFVAFTTPAEARGLGGFMGNWAELTADHGRLSLTRHGRSEDVATPDGQPSRTLDAPPDYVERYGFLHPQDDLRDASLSPDFPSVARVYASAYAQSDGGGPVDGVLSLDPYALAAMLRITGPVRVDGLDERLTADNAVDLLLRRQYVEFPDRADRRDFLDEASERVFDAFLGTKGLRPTQLATTFAPVVAERRLLAYSRHPDEQALLERLGMDGGFPEARGQDVFALTHQNKGNNKLDVFLHREVAYQATVHPATGRIAATATIRLRNDAPTDGLPRYVIGNPPNSNQASGTNWLWFTFYSPHTLTRAQVDGRPLSTGTQREFGLWAYHGYVAVRSGSEAVVELTLDGSLPPASRYEVAWYQQPTVNPDRVSVEIDLLGPAPPVPAPGLHVQGFRVTAVTDRSRTDGDVTVETARP